MTKPSLQDHMNIHTGARPYMCSFCSMTFASCGTHRMHEKAVHLGKKRNLQKKSHKNGIIKTDVGTKIDTISFMKSENHKL